MKSIEEVGRMPCMKNLVKFAQKLPPELRGELYRQVRKFCILGADHGALMEATIIETDHEAFIAFLRQKAQES